MNRRTFFGSILGAACLAVAERVCPSSLVRDAAPTVESGAVATINGPSPFDLGVSTEGGACTATNPHGETRDFDSVADAMYWLRETWVDGGGAIVRLRTVGKTP